MTKQEIFDKVLTFMREQKEPSVDDIGRCRYRYKKNDGTVLKCAAGIFISDEEYTPEIEHVNAYAVFKRLKPETPNEALNIVTKMQSIHDSAASLSKEIGAPFMVEFERKMENYARDHKLIYTARNHQCEMNF